jgi:hypothetical protein
MARLRIRAERESYLLDGVQSAPETRTRVKLPPDPYGDDEPRRSRVRRPLVLLGALIALVLAVAIVNSTTHHSNDPQSGGQPSTPTGAGAPSGVDNGGGADPSGPATAPIQGSGLPANSAGTIPVGYPHTSQGAQSAAANYVVAYESSSMVGQTARHKLIDDIADPSIASSLQSQLDAAYSQVDTAYGLSASGVPPIGQTFVSRATPMGVSLANYDGGSATVSVWVVEITGLAGTGSTHPVTESWTTVTVTLHWTQGDWKWVSFTSSDGPVPTSGQQVVSGGQALQNAVNQFGGLRYAR